MPVDMTPYPAQYVVMIVMVYCYTVAFMDAGRPPRDNHMTRRPWYGWS